MKHLLLAHPTCLTYVIATKGERFATRFLMLRISSYSQYIKTWGEDLQACKYVILCTIVANTIPENQILPTKQPAWQCVQFQKWYRLATCQHHSAKVETSWKSHIECPFKPISSQIQKRCSLTLFHNEQIDDQVFHAMALYPHRICQTALVVVQLKYVHTPFSTCCSDTQQQ